MAVPLEERCNVTRCPKKATYEFVLHRLPGWQLGKKKFCDDHRDLVDSVLGSVISGDTVMLKPKKSPLTTAESPDAIAQT